MSTIQRVAKNTGIVIVGNVIFRVISLIVTIYLARYLGVVEFGKYNLVFAYLTFFGVITDLGLHAILIREMSREPSNAPELIGNAYFIKILLTVFAVVLSIVVISFLPYPKDTTTYTYIAAFTVLFLSFSEFYSTIFQANLKMEYNIFARLVFRILSAILILWIIFTHGTLMQIIAVLVFSEAIKTLISYLFSRKIVRPRFDIDFGLWKYLFKAAFPLALYGVIFIIYFRIDVIMLSIMQGDAAVGIYSAAYKLSEPLSLIPFAFMMSLFPLMSKYFETSSDRLRKSYRLGFKYIFMIVLPIAIGTTIMADKLILLIYDYTFADSASALQILIWAFIFTSLNSVLMNLLISINQQKLNTLSIALCAIINVTLNFILIPIMSYNGAAIATVVTNIVLFIASFYFVSKQLQILPLHKIVIKPVIGSLIMGSFVYCFIDITILLLIALAVLVYFIALLLLKTFSEEDWDIIKGVVSRK